MIHANGYKQGLELAKCLLILLGFISPTEASWYRINTPHLKVESNPKAWMEQRILVDWQGSSVMGIICKSCIKYSLPPTTPEFIYIGNQSNHDSMDSMDKLLPSCQQKYVHQRFYPANATHHSQPVDRHVGHTMQQKVQTQFWNVLNKRYKKIQKGMPVETLNLVAIRKLTQN